MNNTFDNLPRLSGLSPGVSKDLSERLLTPIDKLSRTEQKEAFEKKLKALDKGAIRDLKNAIADLKPYDDYDEYALQFLEYKGEIENVLVKFLRNIDNFEDLNSEESRKIGLKEQELKLEAKQDWANKWRLFCFRVLATILFISSLFVIGSLEHNYEWARLPMSKYLKTIPPAP